VAVFMKQVGNNARDGLVQIEVGKKGMGGDPAEWPKDLRIREYPRLRH
jgi:hypothetical protein